MAMLTRWSPFREVDEMLDRYAKSAQGTALQEALVHADWAPRVDISESDKEFLIKAELPEVKKEDIKVNLANGMLTITGERKAEKEEKTRKFHRVERYFGSFARSFSVPETIEESKIVAEHKDGMLYLHLPKNAKPSKHQVEIKVN